MLCARHDEALEEAVSLLSYDILTSGRSVDGIANIVLNHAKLYTQSTLGYVSVIAPDTRHNLCLTLTGMIGDSCRMDSGVKGIVFPIGEDGAYPALWGHSLNTRQGFYTNDPAAHEAAVGLPRDHMEIRCFLSAPALAHNELLGQISLANRPGGYQDAHLRAVARMARVFAFALDRLRLGEGAAADRAKAADSGEVSAMIASILEDRESLRHELKERLAANLRTLVAPYFDRLMQTRLDESQVECLNQLRASLEEAISPFMARTRMLDVAFSPQELQVALLVKAGLQTKDIAEQLHISINAVNFHRKNIRKKLAISNKRVNLATYLLSLEQW